MAFKGKSWSDFSRESQQAFNAELDKFCNGKIPAEVQKLQVAVGLEALKRVVLRTPVDEGRARANWQVTVNGSIDTKSGGADPSGRGAILYGGYTIKGAPPFSQIFILNNSDYILVLEEGLFNPPNPGPSKDRRRGRFGRILVSGGHSTQAPAGMVMVTLEELRSIFP